MGALGGGSKQNPSLRRVAGTAIGVLFCLLLPYLPSSFAEGGAESAPDIKLGEMTVSGQADVSCIKPKAFDNSLQSIADAIPKVSPDGEDLGEDWNCGGKVTPAAQASIRCTSSMARDFFDGIRTLAEIDASVKACMANSFNRNASAEDQAKFALEVEMRVTAAYQEMIATRMRIVLQKEKAHKLDPKAAPLSAAEEKFLQELANEYQRQKNDPEARAKRAAAKPEVASASVMTDDELKAAMSSAGLKIGDEGFEFEDRFKFERVGISDSDEGRIFGHLFGPEDIKAVTALNSPAAPKPASEGAQTYRAPPPIRVGDRMLIPNWTNGAMGSGPIPLKADQYYTQLESDLSNFSRYLATASAVSSGNTTFDEAGRGFMRKLLGVEDTDKEDFSRATLEGASQVVNRLEEKWGFPPQRAQELRAAVAEVFDQTVKDKAQKLETIDKIKWAIITAPVMEVGGALVAGATAANRARQAIQFLGEAKTAGKAGDALKKAMLLEKAEKSLTRANQMRNFSAMRAAVGLGKFGAAAGALGAVWRCFDKGSFGRCACEIMNAEAGNLLNFCNLRALAKPEVFAQEWQAAAKAGGGEGLIAARRASLVANQCPAVVGIMSVIEKMGAFATEAMVARATANAGRVGSVARAAEAEMTTAARTGAGAARVPATAANATAMIRAEVAAGRTGYKLAADAATKAVQTAQKRGALVGGLGGATVFGLPAAISVVDAKMRENNLKAMADKMEKGGFPEIATELRTEAGDANREMWEQIAMGLWGFYHPAKHYFENPLPVGFVPLAELTPQQILLARYVAKIAGNPEAVVDYLTQNGFSAADAKEILANIQGIREARQRAAGSVLKPKPADPAQPAGPEAPTSNGADPHAPAPDQPAPVPHDTPVRVGDTRVPRLPDGSPMFTASPKDTKGMTAVVQEITPDGKSAKVTLPDGTSTHVPIENLTRPAPEAKSASTAPNAPTASASRPSVSTPSKALIAAEKTLGELSPSLQKPASTQTLGELARNSGASPFDRAVGQQARQLISNGYSQHAAVDPQALDPLRQSRSQSTSAKPSKDEPAQIRSALAQSVNQIAGQKARASVGETIARAAEGAPASVSESAVSDLAARQFQETKNGLVTKNISPNRAAMESEARTELKTTPEQVQSRQQHTAALNEVESRIHEIDKAAKGTPDEAQKKELAQLAKARDEIQKWSDEGKPVDPQKLAKLGVNLKAFEKSAPAETAVVPEQEAASIVDAAARAPAAPPTKVARAVEADLFGRDRSRGTALAQPAARVGDVRANARAHSGSAVERAILDAMEGLSPEAMIPAEVLRAIRARHAGVTVGELSNRQKNAIRNDIMNAADAVAEHMARGIVADLLIRGAAGAPDLLSQRAAIRLARAQVAKVKEAILHGEDRQAIVDAAKGAETAFAKALKNSPAEQIARAQARAALDEIENRISARKNNKTRTDQDKKDLAALNKAASEIRARLKAGDGLDPVRIGNLLLGQARLKALGPSSSELRAPVTEVDTFAAQSSRGSVLKPSDIAPETLQVAQLLGREPTSFTVEQQNAILDGQRRFGRDQRAYGDYRRAGLSAQEAQLLIVDSFNRARLPEAKKPVDQMIVGILQDLEKEFPGVDISSATIEAMRAAAQTRGFGTGALSFFTDRGIRSDLLKMARRSFEENRAIQAKSLVDTARDSVFDGNSGLKASHDALTDPQRARVAAAVDQVRVDIADRKGELPEFGDVEKRIEAAMTEEIRRITAGAPPKPADPAPPKSSDSEQKPPVPSLVDDAKDFFASLFHANGNAPAPNVPDAARGLGYDSKVPSGDPHRLYNLGDILIVKAPDGRVIVGRVEDRSNGIVGGVSSGIVFIRTSAGERISVSPNIVTERIPKPAHLPEVPHSSEYEIVDASGGNLVQIINSDGKGKAVRLYRRVKPVDGVPITEGLKHTTATTDLALTHTSGPTSDLVLVMDVPVAELRAMVLDGRAQTGDPKLGEVRFETDLSPFLVEARKPASLEPAPPKPEPPKEGPDFEALNDVKKIQGRPIAIIGKSEIVRGHFLKVEGGKIFVTDADGKNMRKISLQGVDPQNIYYLDKPAVTLGYYHIKSRNQEMEASLSKDPTLRAWADEVISYFHDKGIDVKPGLMGVTDLRAWDADLMASVRSLMGQIQREWHKVAKSIEDPNRHDLATYGAIRDTLTKDGVLKLGDVIEYRAAVCRELTAALHVVLAEMGIGSRIVSGTVPGGRHAWLEVITPGGDLVGIIDSNYTESFHESYRDYSLAMTHGTDPRAVRGGDIDQVIRQPAGRWSTLAGHIPVHAKPELTRNDTQRIRFDDAQLPDGFTVRDEDLDPIPGGLGSDGYRVPNAGRNDAFIENGGWKLHLTIDAGTAKALDRLLYESKDVAAYRVSSNGNDSKALTVYVGARGKAQSLATEIEGRFGSQLGENGFLKSGLDLPMSNSGTQGVSASFDAVESSATRDRGIVLDNGRYGGVPVDGAARAAVLFARGQPEGSQATVLRDLHMRRMSLLMAEANGAYYAGQPHDLLKVTQERIAVEKQIREIEAPEKGAEPQPAQADRPQLKANVDEIMKSRSAESLDLALGRALLAAHGATSESISRTPEVVESELGKLTPAELEAAAKQLRQAVYAQVPNAGRLRLLMVFTGGTAESRARAAVADTTNWSKPGPLDSLLARTMDRWMQSRVADITSADKPALLKYATIGSREALPVVRAVSDAKANLFKPVEYRAFTPEEYANWQRLKRRDQQSWRFTAAQRRAIEKAERESGAPDDDRIKLSPKERGRLEEYGRRAVVNEVANMPRAQQEFAWEAINQIQEKFAKGEELTDRERLLAAALTFARVGGIPPEAHATWFNALFSGAYFDAQGRLTKGNQHALALIRAHNANSLSAKIDILAGPEKYHPIFEQDVRRASIENYINGNMPGEPARIRLATEALDDKGPLTVNSLSAAVVETYNQIAEPDNQAAKFSDIPPQDLHAVVEATLEQVTARARQAVSEKGGVEGLVNTVLPGAVDRQVAAAKDRIARGLDLLVDTNTGVLQGARAPASVLARVRARLANPDAAALQKARDEIAVQRRAIANSGQKMIRYRQTLQAGRSKSQSPLEVARRIDRVEAAIQRLKAADAAKVAEITSLDHVESAGEILSRPGFIESAADILAPHVENRAAEVITALESLPLHELPAAINALSKVTPEFVDGIQRRYTSNHVLTNLRRLVADLAAGMPLFPKRAEAPANQPARADYSALWSKFRGWDRLPTGELPVWDSKIDGPEAYYRTPERKTNTTERQARLEAYQKARLLALQRSPFTESQVHFENDGDQLVAKYEWDERTKTGASTLIFTSKDSKLPTAKEMDAAIARVPGFPIVPGGERPVALAKTTILLDGKQTEVFVFVGRSDVPHYLLTELAGTLYPDVRFEGGIRRPEKHNENDPRIAKKIDRASTVLTDEFEMPVDRAKDVSYLAVRLEAAESPAHGTTHAAPVTDGSPKLPPVEARKFLELSPDELQSTAGLVLSGVVEVGDLHPLEVIGLMRAAVRPPRPDPDLPAFLALNAGAVPALPGEVTLKTALEYFSGESPSHSADARKFLEQSGAPKEVVDEIMGTKGEGPGSRESGESNQSETDSSSAGPTKLPAPDARKYLDLSKDPMRFKGNSDLIVNEIVDVGDLHPLEIIGLMREAARPERPDTGLSALLLEKAASVPSVPGQVSLKTALDFFSGKHPELRAEAAQFLEQSGTPPEVVSEILGPREEKQPQRDPAKAAPEKHEGFVFQGEKPYYQPGPKAPSDLEMVNELKSRLLKGVPEHGIPPVDPAKAHAVLKTLGIEELLHRVTSGGELTPIERELFAFVLSPEGARIRFEVGDFDGNQCLGPWYPDSKGVYQVRVTSNASKLEYHTPFEILKHEISHTLDSYTSFQSGSAHVAKYMIRGIEGRVPLHHQLYQEFRANLWAADGDFAKAWELTSRTYGLDEFDFEWKFTETTSPRQIYEVLQELTRRYPGEKLSSPSDDGKLLGVLNDLGVPYPDKIRGAGRFGIPGSKNVPYLSTLKENSALDPEPRARQFAGELGVTSEQDIARFKKCFEDPRFHVAGEGTVGRGSFDEVARKIAVMREYGFTPEQRRYALEQGYAGITGPSEPEHLDFKRSGASTTDHPAFGGEPQADVIHQSSGEGQVTENFAHLYAKGQSAANGDHPLVISLSELPRGAPDGLGSIHFKIVGDRQPVDTVLKQQAGPAGVDVRKNVVHVGVLKLTPEMKAALGTQKDVAAYRAVEIVVNPKTGPPKPKVYATTLEILSPEAFEARVTAEDLKQVGPPLAAKLDHAGQREATETWKSLDDKQAPLKLPGVKAGRKTEGQLIADRLLKRVQELQKEHTPPPPVAETAQARMEAELPPVTQVKGQGVAVVNFDGTIPKPYFDPVRLGGRVAVNRWYADVIRVQGGPTEKVLLEDEFVKLDNGREENRPQRMAPDFDSASTRKHYQDSVRLRQEIEASNSTSEQKQAALEKEARDTAQVELDRARNYAAGLRQMRNTVFKGDSVQGRQIDAELKYVEQRIEHLESQLNGPPVRAKLLSPAEAIEVLKTAERSTHDIYLIRGVAPAEANAAINGSENDGRVAGRSSYGIADRTKVAYVMSQTNELDLPSYLTRFLMYRDFMHYGNTGAALELIAKYRPDIPSSDEAQAVARFPKAKGFMLVYKLPADMQLEFHPESHAAVPSRVVAVPKGAKPVAVLPMYDEIGHIHDAPPGVTTFPEYK